MKIIDGNGQESVRLDSLERGAVFECYETIYARCWKFDDPDQLGRIHVVQLADGYVCLMRPNIMVRPRNAKLILTGE